MFKHSRTHLTDGALIQGLKEHLASERIGTAVVLADLAEVDARKLYLPAAYPSMYAYCVGELRLSEDATWNRIRAARTARRFPAIFAAVADGGLHLSAVVLLGPHLTPENADELLAAATHKSKSEIETLLAERFPRMDVPAQVVEMSSSLSPGIVNERAPGRVEDDPSPEPAPGRVERARIMPLAPERVGLQCTISQSTHEKLRYAQALLGHRVATGDLPAVLNRALDALIEQLEKSKFAKTSRPQSGGRRGASFRHIPAEIKRRVWERDHGQCTFVSDKGQRCSARSRLEFDHVDPVACGGGATLDRIRLRCRAHNQYEAERVFGVPFMNHKRAEAKRAAAVRKADAAARGREAQKEEAVPAASHALPVPAPEDLDHDVTPWLRQLGYRQGEARRAAAYCGRIPDASLEDRLRLALKFLAPPHRKVAAPGLASGVTAPA